MKDISGLLARAQAVATAVRAESITGELVGSLLADMIEAMTGLDEAVHKVDAFVQRVEQMGHTLGEHIQTYEHAIETAQHDIQGNSDGIAHVKEEMSQERALRAQANTAIEHKVQAVSTRLAEVAHLVGRAGDTARAVTRSDYLGEFTTQTQATNILDYDYVRKVRRTTVHFDVIDRDKGLDQTATVRTHYYSLGWWHHGLQEMNLGEYLYTRTFRLDPGATTITYDAWKKVLILNADEPLFVREQDSTIHIGLRANNRLQHDSAGQGVHERWVEIGPATTTHAGVMTVAHVLKLGELERRLAALEKR